MGWNYQVVWVETTRWFGLKLPGGLGWNHQVVWVVPFPAILTTRTITCFVCDTFSILFPSTTHYCWEGGDSPRYSWLSCSNVGKYTTLMEWYGIPFFHGFSHLLVVCFVFRYRDTYPYRPMDLKFISRVLLAASQRVMLASGRWEALQAEPEKTPARWAPSPVINGVKWPHIYSISIGLFPPQENQFIFAI